MTTKQKLIFEVDKVLIPIPATQARRTSKFDQLPLLAMSLNQSVFIDCSGQNLVNQRVYFTTWLRKQCKENVEMSKRHFQTRCCDNGFRVWRTF